MEDAVHFRRCHVCGQTNARSDGQVNQCSHCGKALAPFFYFDDRYKFILSEQTLRPPLIEGEYSPIHGLTAYWENY